MLVSAVFAVLGYLKASTLYRVEQDIQSTQVAVVNAEVDQDQSGMAEDHNMT